MELDLIVDTVDSLPEPVRALYRAGEDGKFRLAVKGVEDTSGLKTALQKERQERANYEKQAKAFAGLGKTPEEIAELVEAQRKAEEERSVKAGEWDKLRAQMNEQHTAALKVKEDEVHRMRSTVERYLVNATAVEAIAKAKGVPELLLPHVERQVKVIEENGEYAVRVVDAKGDPRVNAKGEPLSIADLIGEMSQNDIFGRAFEGSGRTGGGTRPSNGAGGANGKTMSRAQFDALDPASQMKAMTVDHIQVVD